MTISFMDPQGSLYPRLGSPAFGLARSPGVLKHRRPRPNLDAMPAPRPVPPPQSAAHRLLQVCHDDPLLEVLHPLQHPQVGGHGLGRLRPRLLRRLRQGGVRLLPLLEHRVCRRGRRL